ncbi:HNH endonuclease [Micromonospora sp. M51]|uniref:HNH endonuclease family protein n=1 Tax=Micromonospora TaxID=1873 RepID=UPI001B36204F|nr:MULTISPECIES: HNH endonuclease family protein [unclassified Micromonospora]MBQ1011510.1 HNH endonuclease [Micromonospora sp. M51]MBQ1029582.1 HNH endonuclease [Micromonospora sp. C97]MDG9673249.1 HNH endonuclease family protein [Micromonospora sp. DH14]
MRTRSGPRAAVAALAAALALGVAGCVPPDEPATPPPSDGGNAVEQLSELTVATAGSMKGYSRDRFPHWRDTGKNCDVRDSILQRDGKDVKLSGCNVVGGRWESVYDGRSFSDPSDVDIDHMVPLANAWRSGADEWDNAKRGDFANDTTRPQLFAVSASSNRAKGDQDPSQWKPANRSYWCKYAQDWVTVKHYWRLTVTSAEKAALTDMLEGC